MENSLCIIAFADKDTVLPPVLEGINTLLANATDTKVQLWYNGNDFKKFEGLITKHKNAQKHIQTGALQVAEYKKEIVLFNNEPANYFWLLNAEYLKNASQLYTAYKKQAVNDNESVYTLVSNNQKESFFTRVALRLFNSVRAKGIQNGFVGFSSTIGQKFKNLKGITPQNFAYKLASYAALSGIEVKEANVALAVIPKKVSIQKSLTNGINNCWHWVVNEPIQLIKDKKIGNIMDAHNPIWRLLYFCLAIVGGITLPFISGDYGITWDEPGEAEYAKLVLNYFTSFGSDKSCFTEAETNTLYGYILYYGPSINLMCAFVDRYLSPFGLYETRHFIISIVGFLGILYAARIGKLLGNWQTAVMVLLILLVSPHFFGHLFNNQKDIPFATGYIISLYYLICFLRELPNPSRKTMLFVALAFGLTIGIRIGGLLLPAYLVMCLGLYWLFITTKQGIKNSAKLILPFLKYAVVISFGAYIVGIAFWPYALQNPIQNPYRALTLFTNFTGLYNFELFEGKLYSITNKPWYYIPKYIGIQTPLFVLAGISLFLVLFITKIKNTNRWFWLLLIFVAAFPVVYAIVQHSSLLNGWRHFLFVYPPLAILAAMGWQWLVNAFKPFAIRAALFIFFIINVGYISFWMVKNHPNQYVYFNELVGGTKRAYSNYETDYYSNSLKQAADWFNKNVDAQYGKTIISTNNQPLTAGYYIEKNNPDNKVIWSKEEELFITNSDYAFITSRSMSHHQLVNGFFPPKNTVHTITVDGIPLVTIVKKENNYPFLAEYYFDKKNLDSAIYYGKKAVEYDGKNLEPLRTLAKAYISSGILADAEAIINNALLLNPDDHIALEIMGELCFKQQQYEKAYSYFTKAINLRENFSKAYTNRGVALYLLKKYPEAIKDFNNTLKYAKPRAEHYNYILKCYYALKNYNKAIDAANNALALDPNYADTYLTLSNVYRDMGNTQDAEAVYNRYLQLGGQ